MNTNPLVDSINHKTMRTAVDSYSNRDKLNPPEEAALSSVADELRNKRILDIGVGGGRTVKALRQISEDYIGVDYVQEMIDECRHRFPGVRFEHADARSLTQFQDRSFDLIVFACAGISMVDHVGRIAILKEARRLLAPNGVFIFSTYNRDSAEHDAWFYFPEYEFSANPAKFLWRTASFLGHTAYRIMNRWRYKRHEVSTKEYSIINDQYHDYRTMMYYITLEKQRQQLAAIGFKPNPKVYDAAGKPVTQNTRGDSMTFVVRA